MNRSVSRALTALCLTLAATSARADEPELRRYLNIRSSVAPGLSPDGSKLTFLTNVTGVAQLWSVPREGGWPEQLTFYEDKLSFARWSPTGDSILFSMDQGGSENFQLYVTSPDGVKVRQLTSNADIRHEAGSWSPDGKQVTYAANQRNKGFFDVYIYDLPTGKERLLFQSDHYNVPVDWSHDGQKILVVRSNSNFDEDLLVVDVASGKETQLNTDKVDVRYEDPQFTADSKGVYVRSDLGHDFLSPGRIDIATRKLTWLAEPKWDTEWMLASDDGRWQAWSTNVEGASQLEVRDLKTQQLLALPPMPRGQLGAPVFSENGRFLALTLSGPRYNSDVWVIDLEQKSVSQVTRSGRSGLPQSGFVEPEVVHYKSFDGKQIPGLLYLPPGAKKDGTLAAIVSIHGGPEEQSVQRFNGLNQFLVARGYAVLEPNVRGSTGYGKLYSHMDDVRRREDSVKDMGAAAGFLKESGYVDPKRLAVMGGSYGGFMVLAALTSQPELWAAGIDTVGIANFKTFLNNTSAYRRPLRIAEYGDPVKDSEFLDKVSPIHHVDQIRAPLMVIQGANDPRVPQNEADQIVEAVKKKGGVVEYLLFPDEGHGIAKLPNRIKSVTAQMKFLDTNVKDRK